MARKMKDSGIEWIGEIPEGWEVHRMKSCISQRDGGAWGDEATGETGDCICLRIADFDYEHFRFTDSNNLTIRHYASPIIKKLLLNCTPCQGQFQRCESVPLDGYRFYYP